MIYPIKTAPVYKQYTWGGYALKTKFGKNTPDGGIAESWEVSCHPDGLSVAANGMHEGRTLVELIKEHPHEMLGGERNELPLLIKLIDANDRLPVQVHPNDETAKSLEGGIGNAKMWYVIDAKPEAKIVYGLKDGVDAEAFKLAVDECRVEEVLNYLPVSAGDSFFIPAGTVHAIGDGLVIAEIQQNSNIPYSLYDYGRSDKGQLHFEKALASINFDAKLDNIPKYPVAKPQYGSVQLLAKCEHFMVIKHNILKKARFSQADDKYEVILCTAGNGRIIYNEDVYEFSAGDSFFIPAAMGFYFVEGECEILRSLE